MPIDLSKLNVSDTSDIDDIVNELFSEESPKVNTQEPIKEVPGASVPSYQTKPEDVGFENVLDKKGFEQRYNVNPNVLSGRQTDPIQKGIESLREKVGKKSNIPQYPLGNRYTYGFGSDYANKTADAIAEKQLSAATENELRGAEKSQSKGGFWSSFGQGIKDEGMWTQGLSEFDNNMTLLYIAKKAEKEGFDNLPEREQDLLTATTLRIASEAANSDEKTAMQIAGMSTAESIPYMLQFMLTSSPASLVTTPVRTAIKKAAEKAIRSGVSSKLIPVVKAAARTAAVGAKATAMTAMQPTMYADMVSRGTGRATLDENGNYAGMEEAESSPVAAYKAFANATIENLSEHSGSMLRGATKAAGNVLKKVPVLGGFISNVQKNNVLSGVNKMMKAVGFNGAPGEFFEEQVAIGLNSLIVGDSQFSDFTNWKQQLATLISVGATAGAMTSTGSLMSVPYKKQIKNNYSEATDLVKDYFSPEEFDQFRASLSNMNIDSRPDFISSVAEAKGFSTDEVKDLTVFATRQAQYDGYVGSVTDKIEEEKIQAQNEINQMSNKDMGEVLEVNGFGENPVNIVGGFVVFDDEGYVDKNKSSQTIYYLDEEGKRKMASPDKFGQLISRKPLADAYAEALNSVEENVIIQEENDLADEETPEQAQQDAMILAENGNQVETPDGVGTISQVEEDENAAIVTFQDGKSKRYSIATLKPYVDPSLQEQLQTEAPISQTEIQTEQPNQDAQIEQAPSFPVDKDGNIDYTQINEPEQYAQALQQEFEGDAVSVIDEQIQSAQARLEKAGNNSDAIKRRRAMKSEQAEVDRLNKVKAILSPSEQIVNEIPAENVENEEASPGEESNMIDDDYKRNSLKRIMEATGDDVFIAGTIDGSFAGEGLLNVDEDGDVVLTRYANDENMLTKGGVITTPEELKRISGSFQGNQIATSGVEGGLKSFKSGVVGEYKIPLNDLIDLIKNGYVIFEGLGNKEFVLSPHIAEKYLHKINGNKVGNQNNLNKTDLSQLTEPERRKYVAENSTDPIELADLYNQVKEEVDYAQMMPWEAALVGRKVSKDSFIENSDKNNITGDMNKSWFSKDGKGLDVIAAELSEYGVPVTEQDLVNFIISHPGNNVKKRSQLSIDTDRKFKEVVKNLTGQEVGGIDSPSGKLILAGLRAGARNEQERQSMPFDSYTIPDSVLNFFEETGLNPEDFNSFEELGQAVKSEVENGTFVFPLGPTDLQTINNIINHGIEQQADYEQFGARVEKAGIKRTAQQPVLETAETEAGTEGEKEGIEPTPEEIAEIEAQLEKPKRRGTVIDIINEIATEQNLRDAEKEVNTTPTEAQKEAGNYKMGHVTIQGLDVSIENPKGSQRSGKDDTGQEWSVTLNNTYGYIKGTKGKDGDHVDVFIGDNPSSENVFVIDQVNKDGSFDEHKVMLGFNSQEEAEAAYKSNYSEGWTGLGSTSPMGIEEFKTWVGEGVKDAPSSEYIQERSKDVPASEELVEDELLFRDGSSETDQIKSEAEKNGTFLKAPNGKDSNLNEKQWIQVRTKAFKEWFGDWENDPENASKVVDENGEPLVMYHGTDTEFTKFSTDKTATPEFWFTDRKDLVESGDVGASGAGIIMPVFLNIRKASSWKEEDDLSQDQIIQKGFDGKDLSEGNERTYVAFNSNQIKSATENAGEFSQNNDDIRFRDAESNRLDKEYMVAVESGDMEKAQRIVDQVAKKNGYVSESEYRLSHRAPHMQPNTTPQQRLDEGRAVSIDDMANGYLNVPDEFFDPRNGAQWYGYDTREGLESYRSLMRAMSGIKQQIKDNGKVTDMPKVTVYRAVSKEVKEGSVRNGDWVSLSQSYAKSHGTAWVDGPSRVIKEEVPADQIWWDSNDINEFGVDDGKGYSYKNTKNNKKLNETITRDDEGNVIPPSKRFNDRKSDVRYKFIGEKGAANIDKAEEVSIRIDNLAIARKMEDSKMEPKKIKMATGWERGSDGKWRYETSDIKINDKVFGKRNIGGIDVPEKIMLSDIVDDNELFEAYPSLKETEVSMSFDKSENGSWNKPMNWISLYENHFENIYDADSENKKSEINSKIKEVKSSEEYKRELELENEFDEKLKKGEISIEGYPEFPAIDSLNPLYVELENAKSEGSVVGYSLKKSARSVLSHEIQHAIQDEEGFATGGSPSGLSKDVFLNKSQKEKISEIDRLFDKLKNSELPNSNMDEFIKERRKLFDEKSKIYDSLKEIDLESAQYEYYRRLAGEVEARNVESRLLMSKEQRSQSLAESTEDVSREDQIFLEGGTSKSIEPIEKEATALADSLNTPIRVIRDVNEITNEDKRKEKRMRSAKGWYDPKTGEVVIVLPNAESVGDVQATILHEIVGHKGLRGLLGDKFEDMMDKVYKHLPKATRKKIMESAVNKYRFDHRTATEEYLAEFVEKDVMEPSIWQKIKSAIKSFFLDLGVNLEMNDADIAYLLWKSKNRLLKGDGAIEVINKVAAGEEAKERFREAAYTDADVLSDELDKSAREAWERLSKDERSVHEIVNETAEVRKGILKYVPTNENVKKSIYELTQGWFDNAVSLRNLQHLVNTVSDQPIESFANPYQFLTTIPARNENKMNTFVKTKFSKIGQAIKELGVPRSTVQIYAYLKHGLERNEYMRAQDVREKGEKLKEAADLRIQAIADSIEAMSRQLETADKKGTNRILAKIEGYNLAIEGIKAELESKKQEYEKSVSHKDYSGVYAVADLFIKKSDDREFTVAQIETAIEEFEKEHDVTKFWDAINGATKWTVQNEFEMGRISKDLRDKLFSMYKYYIPLKGWEEKNANEEWDYISGGGVPVSPIKKSGGRKSLASNLFENIGLGAQTSVMGGHKNLLKLHALRMVRNYPNPMYRVSEVWAVKEGDEWVPKAPEYSEDPEVYADNVVKFEEEMNELKGLGLANKLGGKLNVGRPITKYEAKEHEILVYENGKPYVIYINGNPDIARAINLTGNKPYEVGGSDPTQKDLLKWGINKAMALMRFTGQNLTSRFPGFIAANLLMDTQWAIAAATAKEGSGYAKKLVGNYMSPSIHRSIMRGVRGKLDESNPIDKLFGEFQRAGGETGYSDLFKVDDFEKMIKNELKEGVDWRKSYTWYTGSVDTLNRWAELASRFSTYVTSRNSGRDIERSAYDAKEITLNFNRKGTGAFGANWLKFAYLFAGAGLQGTYSMANLALSKRSRKKITMIFAGTAMLGFIVPLINDLFLGGDDDDLYSKKPDYERKSNILVRIPGSDSFLKLPLPQPMRPFYNIGESLYQMVKGNRNAGEGTMDIIAGFGMMLPFDPFGGSSLMMSAFQPAYQIKENKDFFGQKIFKDDSFTQYDPEFKRAFSNTSPAFVELTRALNDVTGGDEVTKGWLNLNPGILEHLTEGYLGGAFKFVNDIGKQVNGAHEVYKGNPYPYDSRSYPIIGRFYTNTAATSDINAEYYKYVNDAEEISHRVKKYQDLGKKGDQESFDKSLELINSKEYQNAIFVNRMKSQIDNVKKIEKNAEGETLKMLKEQEKELKIMMLNEIEKLNEK